MLRKSTTYLACRRNHQKRGGENGAQKMRESNEGMTVLICENLGQPALLIRTSGAPILLMDAGLSCEDRIDVMNQLLDPDAA